MCGKNVSRETLCRLIMKGAHVVKGEILQGIVCVRRFRLSPTRPSLGAGTRKKPLASEGNVYSIASIEFLWYQESIRKVSDCVRKESSRIFDKLLAHPLAGWRGKADGFGHDVPRSVFDVSKFERMEHRRLRLPEKSQEVLHWDQSPSQVLDPRFNRFPLFD